MTTQIYTDSIKLDKNIIDKWRVIFCLNIPHTCTSVWSNFKSLFINSKVSFLKFHTNIK